MEHRLETILDQEEPETQEEFCSRMDAQQQPAQPQPKPAKMTEDELKAFEDRILRELGF